MASEVYEDLPRWYIYEFGLVGGVVVGIGVKTVSNAVVIDGLEGVGSY